MNAPETFTCAYWDFLRGNRWPEPIPFDYGLADEFAAILRRQCEAEFKNLRCRSVDAG